jgi:hypothetical protein
MFSVRSLMKMEAGQEIGEETIEGKCVLSVWCVEEL